MTEDPFAHLHDEQYGNAYNHPCSSHADAVHMGGRAVISLDGEWHFTPDLFDEGLRQRWFADDLDQPSQWSHPRDAQPFAAEMVSVPSCWTMVQPEWRYFEGSAWYARRFHWDMQTPRLVLRLGAAAYAARVFLNGYFIAAHLGASTPAFMELTRALRIGENYILIQVDNRRQSDRVPMHHFDWFNHGGLYREVGLLPLPSVFIRSCRIYYGSGHIHVQIALSDAVSGVATLKIEALGVLADVAIVDGRGSMAIKSFPELWSPEHPKLYDASVRFAEDAIAERVGFRTITVHGEAILLNDKPIYLRGACVHEDDLHLGKVSTEADVRRRLTHAKELGCNMLRLAHYPHHEHVATIADEVGMLLWAEVPVYWAIDFANPATYADARNQLLELIERDANRASVIVWGVGNENADTDARYDFMSRLATTARAADATRLIGAACLINREVFAIEDRLAADLDVIGLNEYFGWYEPDTDGLSRLLANSNPGKPVIISETGADALAGLRGGVRQLFTEECQAEFYRRQIEIVSQASYVRGFCAWLLYDFRSERRQTGFQRGFNRKGLIAEDKQTRKLAFDVLSSWYHSMQT